MDSSVSRAGKCITINLLSLYVELETYKMLNKKTDGHCLSVPKLVVLGSLVIEKWIALIFEPFLYNL